jgi:hypothetical protein
MMMNVDGFLRNCTPDDAGQGYPADSAVYRQDAAIGRIGMRKLLDSYEIVASGGMVASAKQKSFGAS